MLLHQLCQLQAKQRKLKRELERHRPFADYLMKVLERIPKGCSGAEEPEAAQLEALVQRCVKLLVASGDAQQHLDTFSQMSQAVRQGLESLEDSHRVLMACLKTRLCQLQEKCHSKQGQWQQLESSVTHQDDPGFDAHAHAGGYSGQLLSYLQVAINNMAQQCHPRAQGVPTSLGLFSKLDLIQGGWAQSGCRILGGSREKRLPDTCRRSQKDPSIWTPRHLLFPLLGRIISDKSLASLSLNLPICGPLVRVGGDAGQALMVLCSLGSGMQGLSTVGERQFLHRHLYWTRWRP
ncbi:uncharacterized protein CCDC197 isoform X2 [Fukomys damarensis]|uniref:uncharacterized protein CCDC197 isoform X2 n=1 Tax=Fukomys damarensis TaxID=885580 RepID=UPI001454EA4E|nr:uncharacterized protein CCDC197 isoform X2 [Fukomys damarensis]